MKKFIITLMIVALGVTSCSVEEPTPIRKSSTTGNTKVEKQIPADAVEVPAPPNCGCKCYMLSGGVICVKNN